MTIHGSKLELEQLKYHENRDNTSIDAPLISESHNFWFDRSIFKFHTFSKIGNQDLSKGVKINSIHDLLKVATLEGLPPWKACQGYKKPQVPSKPKEKGDPLSFAICLDDF